MYKITLLLDWLLKHEEIQIGSSETKKLSSKGLALLGLQLNHTVKSLLKDLEKFSFNLVSVANKMQILYKLFKFSAPKVLLKNGIRQEWDGKRRNQNTVLVFV